MMCVGFSVHECQVVQTLRAQQGVCDDIMMLVGFCVLPEQTFWLEHGRPVPSPT
jgi:hypothetical protein